MIVSSSSKVLIFRLTDRTLIQSIPFGGPVSLCNGTLMLAGYDGVLRSYILAGGGNQLPVATAQTATCIEDDAVTITLGGTDSNGDLLAALIDTLPARGSLHQTTDGVQVGEPISSVPVLVSNPSRKVIYRPPPDAFGNPLTSLTFRVNDGIVNSAAATISINVTNVNDAPTAVDDQFFVRPGEVLSSFWPSANDIDADGETLTISSFAQPSRGTVTQNGDGSLRFTPSSDFQEGIDSFSYTVRDSLNTTSSAVVSITVSPTFGRAWPTFGNGPDHTGRYPGSIGTTPLSELWLYQASALPHSFAVAEGQIFYTWKTAAGGYMQVASLDLKSGAERWKTQFPSATSMNPSSCHSGLIYFQLRDSSGSKLVALTADNGSVQWQSPFGSQWEGYMAPAVNDQAVYINGGTYGGIYAFDRVTGVQKFFVSLEQYSKWTPTLYNGEVFSFVMGKFRCHEPSTGAVLWSLDLGWNGYGEMNRTVATEGGKALLINDKTGGNELVCIDLSTKSVLWRVPGTFTGTPAVMGGIVYGLSGGTVQAYGLSAGNLLGGFVAPGETSLMTSPVLAGDVLIASSATKTYFFDLHTRQVFQTLNFGSQPAIVEEVVYLACSDGSIRAYGRIPSGNQRPVATPAQVTIVEDSSAALQLEALDPEGEPISLVIRSLPQSGRLFQTSDGATKSSLITSVPVLVSNSNGIVIFEGAKDAWGAGVGNFTFTAHDAFGPSAAATALEIVSSSAEDTAATITLAGADSDNDPLTFVITALPNFGTLHQTSDGITAGAPILKTPTNVANADGKVLYMSPQDRFGTGFGNFTYAASDGKTSSSSAGVSITVTPVNDPPFAIADQRQIEPGQILSPIREILNDQDADRDSLKLVAFEQPPAGRVVQNSDGTLRYHPPVGATQGSEQFSYTIEDAFGHQSSATVTVTISPSIQGFWPTFGNGTDHTGYSSVPSAWRPLQQRWSYQAGQSVKQPIVVEGKVVITSIASSLPTVTALQEKTGGLFGNDHFHPDRSIPQVTFLGESTCSEAITIATLS